MQTPQECSMREWKVMMLRICVAENNAVDLIAARLALSSHLNVRHLFSTIWYLLKIKDGI
jgi:hypothetical protein